jgi:hypothetical protein
MIAEIFAAADGLQSSAIMGNTRIPGVVGNPGPERPAALADLLESRKGNDSSRLP